MSDYTEHLISMAGGDGEPDLAAIQAAHYEGVAYADDVPEGGDEEVPEDFEHHYCNEDGEDWPCATIRAALTATEGA